MKVYSNEYVNQFVLHLDHRSRAKIQHLFNLLEKYGDQLRMPHVRKMTSSMFELRIRGDQEIRILFTYFNNSCYLLHGFIKKTQQTPKKEIRIALDRFSHLK